ncbi:MAG TPA: alpha/beta fold hydrolase, partial [Gammaproteobacteria bacterium]|nr:alpha/beta fold hydrolase [Gammaproteobacteria bacterium]
MRGYAATENTMESWDGTKLFYRAWIPEQQPNRAVLLFHRGHEHSARLIDLVEQLNLGEDFAYFAWDARGNGKSPGERDYAETFSVYARDADCFASHISDKYKIEISQMALIANSVGAVIACSWVHDYAPPIKALVMAAPAFRIKLYI